MFDSPREMYALLEEKLGRRGAALVFYLVVGGAASAGLLAIGTLVIATSKSVVSPLITAARGRLPVGRNLISLALAIAISLTVLAVLMRIAAKQVRKLMDAIDNDLAKYAKGVDGRLKHLEDGAADVETANRAVRDLHIRVAALESMFGKTAATAKDALVDALRGPNHTVRNVGAGPVRNVED